LLEKSENLIFATVNQQYPIEENFQDPTEKNQDLKLWPENVPNFSGGSSKTRAKKQQNC
jgi:hypothetical protein